MLVEIYPSYLPFVVYSRLCVNYNSVEACAIEIRLLHITVSGYPRRRSSMTRRNVLNGISQTQTRIPLIKWVVIAVVQEIVMSWIFHCVDFPQSVSQFVVLVKFEQTDHLRRVKSVVMDRSLHSDTLLLAIVKFLSMRLYLNGCSCLHNHSNLLPCAMSKHIKTVQEEKVLLQRPTSFVVTLRWRRHRGQR